MAGTSMLTTSMEEGSFSLCCASCLCVEPAMTGAIPTLNKPEKTDGLLSPFATTNLEIEDLKDNE